MISFKRANQFRKGHANCLHSTRAFGGLLEKLFLGVLHYVFEELPLWPLVDGKDKSITMCMITLQHNTLMAWRGKCAAKFDVETISKSGCRDLLSFCIQTVRKFGVQVGASYELQTDQRPNICPTSRWCLAFMELAIRDTRLTVRMAGLQSMTHGCILFGAPFQRLTNCTD